MYMVSKDLCPVFGTMREFFNGENFTIPIVRKSQDFPKRVPLNILSLSVGADLGRSRFVKPTFSILLFNLIVA